MSNEALYHESLDKLNLSCRTGLSFNFKEQTEQEAQLVVDLGGSVTHIPSPQPSPTYKPAGLPSRAALTYTPANAKTYPSAEWELTNDKPQAEGDGFMLWKEYAPVILTRRSSSLQSEREQVLDAVSSLGLKGPVKGLGKLSRPVLNKYYRTEQALAEFLIKQDRVLLRPLPSPETGQRELERLETELFDTSKYMGSTNYMTVLTWSDDNPWGTITLFQVETPLMGSVSQGGYLESQRRKPPNLHVHVREPFATKIKPVAAMEHIPQQILVNMRMDTAIRKLVLVHEQNSQRFRWMAKGEMGHPSYATIYRPDMPVSIAVQRSLYEHLDADEAAILGHHSHRRPSCLSPQAGYQDRQEVTADGIVATIPQFLALLHSTQSIVEVASSPKPSDEERVETTSETLKDIFHQFLHNDTIFTPFKYIRPVPAETPLHITDKNDIRCDTVGFKPTFWIHHPGAYAAYLSAVPPGKTISNYAGDGDWFKIWEFGTYPNLTAESTYQQTWRLLADPLTFQIPTATPPGKYLLRFEHVALHLASQRGGAEFYPSCAHVEVLNAGWKSTGLSPGPTARFPEAHEAEEHGKLVFNIWDFDDVQQLNSRKMPGPQVWDGR
ncbi:hypothetical protein QC764_0046490 [Podospora pseudoanserina]|uniref:lytic cellulose monooxygenase (C4-dehydrogenating) n=1 Tax=Podospora pseudoanserina TaxID=2609844 RepID=A0ABR0IB17_9PEZI|nr:hypothetical protein QC764_0046490 [Podospora pseudoanserina]